MNTEIEDIRPYNDEETREAMSRLSRHPFLPVISKYIFPGLPINFLSGRLRDIQNIDQLQEEVMCVAIKYIIENTSNGFSYSGADNVKGGRRFLAVSNHRDIVMDPALLQYMMLNESMPFTEVCVGSNLLSNKTVADLLRSNRMIKVIRGIGAREMYLNSRFLSQYIRESITTGRSSVWIAQREGRTKDGIDVTEQGLLKMFDMSGAGSFEENFKELNIIPFSISYEFEPCDAKKAREVLIKRSGPYVKKRTEDMHSILTGIRQQKGRMHLEIGKPLTEEEISEAAKCEKNDRYQSIRAVMNRRIIEGYRLWPNNFIAYDLLSGKYEYASRYTDAEKDVFLSYMNRKLAKVQRGLDREALKEVFLGIYANPIKSKLDLGLTV